MNSKLTYKDNPEWILIKMRNYCAYQERCVSDVRTKLQSFNIVDKLTDNIISQLMKEDYVNEERYARVFAHGKFMNNKWGRNKIFRYLQQKKIPEMMIQMGLQEIDEKEYFKILEKLITRKIQELSDTDLKIRKNKIITFAVGKGFEVDLVREIMKKINL
ncbi:MAG: RecX family transcriptional regulator [Bacteroidales bacterium]|nr:RecX family transcriptional regulator [Bacteroidales bacterium]